MTMHKASFSLVSPAQPVPGSLPTGHLELINASQARKGKEALKESDLIARPILLFGNQMTSYFTKMPDDKLRELAQQINQGGGPMLSAHVTDTTPLGTFYLASVDPGEDDGELILNTWAYWLNDDTGQKLVRQIDGGIINEASIGYWYTDAICSITGLDYGESPYWAGETYDVTDPSTGETEKKLCFIWTTGDVEFIEGSLVYRGAYPGTKVGGEANKVEAMAQTLQTRFQMAASREMLAVFSKERPENAERPKSENKETDMKVKLTLKSGAVKEVDADKVQSVMEEEIRLAEERAAQNTIEKHASHLGLEPKDVNEAMLTDVRKQAADGKAYRQDLLQELGTLTLAIEGNEAADVAERVKKAYNNLPIEDISSEVKRLRAKRDAMVPNVKLSQDNDENPRKETRPDYDNV